MILPLLRLIDLTAEPSGLPLQTLAQALMSCCELRCHPHASCSTDHHGPERQRYNRRIWGTEEPYRLDDAEVGLRERIGKLRREGAA